MKRGDQYVYRLPNDALFEQNFMLQPSENRNINYDPHFNDPSKQTKKQIIEHEKIQFRFNTSVYSILAPDQVRFYPNLNLSTGNIWRKTYHRRHCPVLYRPKSTLITKLPTAALLRTSSDRALLLHIATSVVNHCVQKYVHR